jgi:hypothetical protein
MTTQEQEQTRDAWDKIATGYDEFVTPGKMWVANEGLHRAGLHPAMRFLDVAAGSGALSIPAARHRRIRSVSLLPQSSLPCPNAPLFRPHPGVQYLVGGLSCWSRSLSS